MFIYWQRNLFALRRPSPYFWVGQPFLNMPVIADEDETLPPPVMMDLMNKHAGAHFFFRGR